MSMFPTNVAMRLAKGCGIPKLLPTELHLEEAMADFQKVSATGEFEDALIMLNAHIISGELSEEQLDVLGKIYDFTQIEIDGIVVDSIGRVMRDSDIESNKLHAAKLLHAIRNGEGGEDLTKSVRKVIFEMDKD